MAGVNIDLYNLYAPILDKLGTLSRIIIQEKISAFVLPKKCIDDNGFLRMQRYIMYKRSVFGQKADKIDWPFIDKCTEDDYPEYNAFIYLLSILHKSINVFYVGKNGLNTPLNVDAERKYIICLTENESVLGFFTDGLSTKQQPYPPFDEENIKYAKSLIKLVMETANDQYKELKKEKLQKKSKIA